MATAVGGRAALVATAGRTAPGERIAWLDNLKVAVIVGVVLAHVAATYVVQMPWYYEERHAGLPSQAILSALFGPGVLYAMAALFLIAGMLNPVSLRKKGARDFITSRLLRLGLPLVLSTWILVPATALVGAVAEGEVRLDGAGPFLAKQAGEVDTGVMWFVAALLVFSIAYAAVRSLRPGGPRGSVTLRGRHLAMAMGAIAVGSFVVRLGWPMLSVTPGHLNLWEWPSMATLYVVGVLAGERGWFDPMPDRLRRACGWLGAGALVASTLFFAAVAYTGDDSLLGGWNLQALIGPGIEGVLAVILPLWLVAWFRRRWTQHGPLARALGRSSFAAYVFHPLVIVVIAVALRPFVAPAEVKFVVVGAAGVVASFVVGRLLTRIRPLARVL